MIVVHLDWWWTNGKGLAASIRIIYLDVRINLWLDNESVKNKKYLSFFQRIVVRPKRRTYKTIVKEIVRVGYLPVAAFSDYLQ